jgi:putative phage-type endonuclease
MSTTVIDSAFVADSIASHCSPGISDMGGSIDRVSRMGNKNVRDIQSLISTVTGQMLTETDVIERHSSLEKYRSRLKEMLPSSERGITQRTPDWYSAREVMITASDFAQALGFSKFGNRKDFYEKKCGFAPPKAFDDSIPPLRWGVMFEPVANYIYSRLNGNAVVHEFGLLRHPTIPFLGASPDGVTEDGIMLEIKCPWRRKIDGTVPQQYYFQIQGQLAVCGLSECDYFEVEFDELRSSAEVDAEFCYESYVSHEEEVVRSVMRGVFIEVKTHGNNVSTKYVYPDPWNSVETTYFDHLRAFVKITTGSETENHFLYSPGKCDETKNYKVIWWRLRRHNTIKVRADKEFINNMIDELRSVWSTVTTLRVNRSKYDTFIKSLTKDKSALKSIIKSGGSEASPRIRKQTPKPTIQPHPQVETQFAFIDDPTDNYAW